MYIVYTNFSPVWEVKTGEMDSIITYLMIYQKEKKNISNVISENET